MRPPGEYTFVGFSTDGREDRAPPRPVTAAAPGVTAAGRRSY